MFPYPLSLSFVGSLILVINPREVGDNDRHRQRDHEHSGKRAHTTHDLASYSTGYHVTVPGI